MATNGGTVQFAPISTGNMKEIPPDLPAGTWEATCSVKKSKTAKDSFPMLILEWGTNEALTEGNEDFVGARATDFCTFFPQSHKASRMSKIRLKTMCDALGIEVPSATQLDSWDDLSDFIGELDGCRATIYTTVELRKDTGEQVTKIYYRAPGSSLTVKAAPRLDDDDLDATDSDEEEAPPPVLAKRSASPKKGKR